MKPKPKNEDAVTSGVLKFLRSEYPGKWVKIGQGPYSSEAGISDVTGTSMRLHGRAVWIELKAEGRTGEPFQGMSVHQVRFIDAMLAAGAIAFYADSVDEVRDRLLNWK